MQKYSTYHDPKYGSGILMQGPTTASLKQFNESLHISAMHHQARGWLPPDYGKLYRESENRIRYLKQVCRKAVKRANADREVMGLEPDAKSFMIDQLKIMKQLFLDKYRTYLSQSYLDLGHYGFLHETGVITDSELESIKTFIGYEYFTKNEKGILKRHLTGKTHYPLIAGMGLVISSEVQKRLEKLVGEESENEKYSFC
jgi:hypothetical protein